MTTWSTDSSFRCKPIVFGRLTIGDAFKVQKKAVQGQFSRKDTTLSQLAGVLSPNSVPSELFVFEIDCTFLNYFHCTICLY